MTPEIGCVEAERSLLGCLLRMPAAEVVAVAQRLQVEDFVDPANRVLLGAVVAIALEGQDPDPTLVVLELRRRGLEHSFTCHQGAGLYVLEVFGAAGVPSAVGAYVRGVLEHSYRRRVQEVGERLRQVCEAHPFDDLHDVVGEQARSLDAAWRRLQQPIAWPALEVA